VGPARPKAPRSCWRLDEHVTTGIPDRAASAGWCGVAEGAEADQSGSVAALGEQGGAADAVLFGRVTFEEVRGYWPKQTDDAAGVSDDLNWGPFRCGVVLLRYRRSLDSLSEPGTMHSMEAAVQDRNGLLAQMRRGAIEHCVLALLRRQERYAPELVENLASRDGIVTSEGTIYPLLSRLRRDGLVDTTWRESASGPPRRYYRVTPSGEQALERFTREWSSFAAAVDEILEIER
jgi:PadR family transcriptional regulator, regulatory protein PadR